MSENIYAWVIRISLQAICEAAEMRILNYSTLQSEL